MRYLILGGGGMAGHAIANYLLDSKQYVEAVARRKLSFCPTHIIDALNYEEIGSLIRSQSFDFVVNAIGILNNKADSNKDYAVLLNSFLPHYVGRICLEKNIKLIHISTDCVFSGKKGGYVETDFTDGKSFYDRSKALGEINYNNHLTFRQSIIGPDINRNGIGLFHWFLNQDQKVQGYKKTIWSGVTTLVLAQAILKASQEGLGGLYHLTNNKKISKGELLLIFNKYTGNKVEIEMIDGVEHDKSIVNTRCDFNFTVPSYEKQVLDMVKWVRKHPELYGELYPNIYKVG